MLMCKYVYEYVHVRGICGHAHIRNTASWLRCVQGACWRWLLCVAFDCLLAMRAVPVACWLRGQWRPQAAHVPACIADVAQKRICCLTFAITHRTYHHTLGLLHSAALPACPFVLDLAQWRPQAGDMPPAIADAAHNKGRAGAAFTAICAGRHAIWTEPRARGNLCASLCVGVSHAIYASCVRMLRCVLCACACGLVPMCTLSKGGFRQYKCQPESHPSQSSILRDSSRPPASVCLHTWQASSPLLCRVRCTLPSLSFLRWVRLSQVPNSAAEGQACLFLHAA